MWRHHPEDEADRFSTAPVLAIDPSSGELGATRRLPALQPVPEDHRLAVLAPCLGAEGRFEPAEYAAGTYDVRHVVDVDNRWPSPAAWPRQSWATLRNDPGNRLIVKWTAAFDDRGRHVDALLAAVDEGGTNPRWARYNRSLIVVSNLDAADCPEERRRWALVATSAVTPPEAFAIASAAARITRPAVFELVQGGSFGFGVWHAGRLFDLSQAGRDVDYYRGVQGLWFGCLAMNLAESNLRMATRSPLPVVVPELEEGTWTGASGVF
jgi:hypothetical protein